MNQLTTSSRVRIRTQPPLPPCQAWVAFNPKEPIAQLKTHILSLLGNTPITTENIQLQLDGFAFLDQCLCQVINPTQDLIDVTTVSVIPTTQHIEPSKKRRRSQAKTQLDPNTSSEQQPPNELPQRSKSQPIERVIKPLAHSKTSQPTQQHEAIPTTQPPSTQNVIGIKETASPTPPGQGKASTKARNMRKKMKRMREREEKQLVITNPGQSQSNTNGSTELNHQSKLAHSKKELLPLQQTNGVCSAKGASKKPQPNKNGNGSSHNPTNTHTTTESSSSCESSSGSSTGSSSVSSASSSEDSESEPDTSVPKSTLSDASSQPSELSSKPHGSSKADIPITPKTTSAAYQTSAITHSAGQVTQKTVSITPNPHLTMLSLSNKNKRKNLKRKSCPEQQALPTKIVFESSAAEVHRKISTKSPCHMPPSPNRTTLATSPSPIHAHVSQTEQDVDQHDYMAVEEEEMGDYFDQSITYSAPSHGPPPSARHPSLIPPNVLITSVNLLNPYWTPGQVGTQWSSAHATNGQAASGSSVSKRTRKNRKKSLKKRRRLAAKTRLLEQGQRKGEDDEDEEDEEEDNWEESEFDEEVQRDVEEAYAEFISTGGHSLAPTGLAETESPDPRVKAEAFLKTLDEEWEQLEKVDRKNAVLGCKVAVRTIELSVESFTPERMTYYGTLIGTNEGHVTLKLDAGCIPATQAGLELEGEQDVAMDEQACAAGDQEGAVGVGEEEEEEREELLMVDVKEAIRAQQRHALALDVWGHSQSRDVRNWEWSTILDARKL